MNVMKGVFSILLLGLLTGGCAIAPDQGALIRSIEVDKLVESATVLVDHTYYFTGPEARPDAIIAIHNNFSLASKYWIRIDAAEEKLRWWHILLQNDTRYMRPYEGYWILTPEGKQAGLWYSKYDYSVIRFPDASTIILYTPSPMEERRKHLRGGFVGR